MGLAGLMTTLGESETCGGVRVADTVTVLGADARGAVLVAASHGAAYAAALAAKAGVRAVILNDAGGGRDDAGLGALAYGESIGLAVALVGHDSCRIGDGADMMARGVIRHANAIAAIHDARAGSPCAEAAAALRAAPVPRMVRPLPGESRQVIDDGAGRPVVLVDSAALVEAEDAGCIVVTGSHGGLVGGDPAKALRVDAFAALFNDAGGGADDAGFGRLPALAARGIAAATVSTASARIGSAASTIEDGVLSRVNEPAARLGGAVGQRARDFVAALRRA